MQDSRLQNSTNVRINSELALQAFLTPSRPPRPAAEQALIDVAEPLALTANGLPIAAWAWGQGPVVLLVHGWSGRGTQLGGLVTQLVNRGRRVITWDAPAHGASPGRRTTLAGMAETVRAVARQVGPIETIVAHSFGAAATTIAVARGLEVARIAYVGPLFHIAPNVERYLDSLSASPEARADFHELLATANLASREHLEGAHLAPQLTAPLLVVHDRDDREVPYGDGVALAAACPGATLFTTAGLGHRRILGDRDVLDAITRFAISGERP